MLGPIDYVVMGFKGNNFDGSVLTELEKASDSGAIRVVDLAFIIKDAEGNTMLAEIKDQPEELKELLAKLGFDDETPFVTEGDLLKVVDSMEKDTAAGILVIEHLWAKGLKGALKDAGASVVDQGRVPTDTIESILKDMEEFDELEDEIAEEEAE